MNSEKNIEGKFDEHLSLETIFQYVNEKFYGLLLLVCVFFIIYFVDYISNLNAMLSAVQPPIPGMQITANIPLTKLPKKKFKKFKKQ
jgi:hypothetical protein